MITIMNKKTNGQRLAGIVRTVSGLMLVLLMASGASAFTVTVKERIGNAYVPVGVGFRYLVEEDNTNITQPGVPVVVSIATDIHKSHAPVVTKGSSAGATATVSVPNTKPYYISVLPDSGYTLSGAAVPVGAGAVDVYVNKLPVPTAQISVKVFEDHNPINNVFDAGERGLKDWTVTVDDGTFAGGVVSVDVFGNPLGTTYQTDGSGQFIMIDDLPQVLMMGSGVITTDVNGDALVKYLAPGKYGIKIVPPNPEAGKWIQTATIEGTPAIDAWVKSNEPAIFIEGFGAGGRHAMFGFVNKDILPVFPPIAPPLPALSWSGSISGRAVINHFNAPPLVQGYHSGPPVTECWVGLNNLAALNKGLYAAPCNADGTFTISNVPPGTYQLVIWDKPLDVLFTANTVVVPAGADGLGTAVNLADILIVRWFGVLQGRVFYDSNENGFLDSGEAPLGNKVVNIRFRDGSIYQSTVSDGSGEYAFPEVFPFFKWLITEIDFATLKATGMTAVVDGGGKIPETSPGVPNQNFPVFGALNPQVQADGKLWRTETGPVLLQAMQLYLGQTNVIDWGKNFYRQGENGGISGVVWYAATRAEGDPRFAAAETWEVGIPRVKMRLFADGDICANPNVFPGPNDVDWNGNGVCDAPSGTAVDLNKDGRIDDSDAVSIVTTDSFDDNRPSGCIQTLPVVHGQTAPECADNFGTWNQMRPGVFDGGYAFTTYIPGGVNSGNAEKTLPAGTFIVEMTPPVGYEILKEEDVNVTFGQSHTPSLQALPWPCVGDLHRVPAELSLFPGNGTPPLNAGKDTPLCNRKQVKVEDGKNTAADFFLFTEVPKAARVVGFANNDLAAEFNVRTPTFGEKTSPSWIPASFRDYAGNEVYRAYVDEYGSYNALLPSTFSPNIPTPSGFSPNMITLVLNDPFLPDGSIDPFYDPNYGTTPWTLNYMPGKTTYLDTPIVPIAAFVKFPNRSLDTDPQTGTPVINSVVVGTNGGPIVCNAADVITITSKGSTKVPNPYYDPNVLNSQPFIFRNYGFGTTQGTVTVGGVALTIVSWSDSTITATIPPGLASGQLLVTRGDNGQLTPLGLTLTVSAGVCGATIRTVVPGAGTPIQNAIDAALPGDTILVAPGNYKENVILYKPLTLQGSGEGTIISAYPDPADRLSAWHAKTKTLLNLPLTAPNQFIANEAPGIMVLGSVAPAQGGSPFGAIPAKIDGFKIMGAIQGGGIYIDNNVNSTNYNLSISNNFITGNQGNSGGGIVIGTMASGLTSINNNISITYNQIIKNGGVTGGGGITIYSGADNYLIANNLISGNLTRYNGAGIYHYGRSNNSVIENNKITFNETFFGGVGLSAGDGGGIAIGGDRPPVVAPAVPPPTAGAGSVTIRSNLIQGNLSGTSNGGGINVSFFNGLDVGTNDYTLNILNNIIVNNVAGYQGGGIYLQDAAYLNIAHNTIANNDAASTAAAAFVPGTANNNSLPQPAGIVSNPHSAELVTALAAHPLTPKAELFSNPNLINNIIWHNRSFYFDTTINPNPLAPGNFLGGTAPNAAQQYWDLQVNSLAASYLTPKNSILSGLTDAFGANYNANGNITADPLFISGYVNTLSTATVIDEAGNRVSVRFSPTTLGGSDYHLSGNASPAVDNGGDLTFLGLPAAVFTALGKDYDAQPRDPIFNDIGADEIPFTATSFTQPAAGTVLQSGQTFDIRWTGPYDPLTPLANARTFSVWYSVNNGRTWNLIINNLQSHRYTWTVPALPATAGSCKVMIAGFNTGSKLVSRQISSGTFTITVP